ncbi:hypothetical protein [Pelagerythrobacter marinus]|uniref:hypothetical protein n=1 Tax=Pelagerythrobacter marinus TaxID=538382 RepID=UPI002AC9CD03|nr:hypothetical protein [Pelagerythrobacter marinus]WPZ05465.1 hypothetical protein T8T98_08460 [Pelagerythrobacter marinus]
MRNAANDTEEGVAIPYIAARMQHSGRFFWRIIPSDGPVISGFAPNSMAGMRDMMRAAGEYSSDDLVRAEIRLEGNEWSPTEIAVTRPE